PPLRPPRPPQPSARACPAPRSALATALFVHPGAVVQSRGGQTRPVDWAQSAALLVRRDAVGEVGWLDPDFFVASDEVDLGRRLADHGWQTLYVPSARAIHHEQLSTGPVPERRIVEMSRNRELYMRKHHSAAAAAAVRWLTAWAYAVRALAATVLPGHDPARYMAHVRATLNPGDGEGLREAAEEFNRQAAAGSSPTG
ncbi:MAG: glycosyltransferase family 2 protein, partial [Solirubrobacterales bacterium]